jgi:parallel beta-helix repeat protein
MGFSQGYGAGPTYVKDNIMVSTTWAQANSPYILQNDIEISKGAILTIQPGVEVQFTTPSNAKVGSGSNLVVKGALKAVGSATAPIWFKPAVQGSLWGAIFFTGSDPQNCVLQGCYVKGGRIVCNNASPSISQCAIFGAQTGIELYTNSNAQIVGNRITSSGYGIYLFSDTASPTITGNEIYNNNIGFIFRDFGTPTITGNKIYGNLKANMVNYSAKPLSVPNNDFRSADAQQIMKTIYDGAYNQSLGRINFMPFVGMPEGQGTQTLASVQPAQTEEKPKVQDEDFWSYGRPFDAMKISNVEQQKNKPSNAVKILAVGATAVVTVVLLFL